MATASSVKTRLEPAAGLGIEAEFVVSTAQVLNERMPATDNLGGADALQAAHRSRSSLQPAVICFNRVVGVLLHDVPRLGHELVEHTRVRRGPIGGHLGRPSRRVKCPGEEPAGHRQIPLRRGQDIDDLPVLVDRPVQVHPLPSNLQIRLVHEPAIPGDVPARPGGVDQLRGEPLYPPVDRDMIHRDAAFGQSLFHIAVGQAVAQVPAQRQHDDLWWEPEPGEAGPRRLTAGRRGISPAFPSQPSANATEPYRVQHELDSRRCRRGLSWSLRGPRRASWVSARSTGDPSQFTTGRG